MGDSHRQSQHVTGMSWCPVPSVLGENFAAEGCAHVHEAFKYL